MTNRLPEHQFAYWFVGESVARSTKWISSIWRAKPLLALSRFSREFNLCLRAGLPVADAFEKCRLANDCSYLKKYWEGGRQKMLNGESITESLRGAEPVLPVFFLPVVAAGERSGQVDEVFKFLENHLRLLIPLSDLLRKLWLYPVLIILAGTFLRSILLMINGHFVEGCSVVFDTVLGLIWYFVLAAVIWLSPLRVMFDELRLRLPWVSTLEHDLAVNRFFSVMALLEKSQCDRVDEMIRTASKTVSNRAITKQLSDVIHHLDEQATLGEAFATASHFDDQVRQTVQASELSGTLLEGYRYLAEQAESRLTPMLQWIHVVSAKIVTFLVIYCLLGEALRLAFASI